MRFCLALLRIGIRVKYMVYPTTIKLFLVNGQPDGLRTAEILNWSGWAVACPRSDLSGLKTREELKKPGIYFLVGVDDDSDAIKIYIGEADDVVKRVTSKDHSDKEFWAKVICFVSKDSNLSKGHIKYLEGKLIERANELGVPTGNSKGSGATLSESDMADMHQYLDKLNQLLPVLGLGVYKVPEVISDDAEEWLYCTIHGLKSKGRRTPNGFLVTKGSQAVKEHRPSATYWRRKRESLIENKVLIETGDHFVFDRDYEFTSPTAAGAAVRGGATNGLTAWKNSKKLTLKDIESNSSAE